MEPWWTGVQAGWFGAIAGTACGLFGTALGMFGGFFAPRGKYRSVVNLLIFVPLTLGVVSAAVGIVAICTGQPYHVWYPTLLMGVVCTVVFGGLLPVFRARYREAEMRRLEAEALRRS